MTDKTTDLDGHCGMAARKATDLRRLLSEVEANEKVLRAGRERRGLSLPAVHAKLRASSKLCGKTTCR